MTPVLQLNYLGGIMSNYQPSQNPLSNFDFPYKTQWSELQEALDALPPTLAVWVQPHDERRSGLLYATVALVGNDGSMTLLRSVINPDPEVPFNLDEALARELSIETFRMATEGYVLVFYDADKDLEILNGYVSADADICCAQKDLAEAFCECDEHNQLATCSFDDVIERLGISGEEAPHPALTNAARLLEAWTWSIQDCRETEMANANPSFQ
jgi:hypothetical protein